MSAQRRPARYFESRIAAKDSKAHDATVAFGQGGSGITLHCNNLPDLIAAPKLGRHCELRKYSQKANIWFGLLVSPGSGALRSGLMLDYPWVANKQLDRSVENMPKPLPPEDFRRLLRPGASMQRKIGRNERCPCGSGLKYKKCCINKQEN